MKTIWLRFVMLPAMAGGMLLAAPEVATQPASPPTQHQACHRRAARIADFLNLTPAQRQAAKTELHGAWTAAGPIRQQLRQVRQQMFQAVRANDTGRIRQLSA